jgi:hypothetical protein
MGNDGRPRDGWSARRGAADAGADGHDGRILDVRADERRPDGRLVFEWLDRLELDVRQRILDERSELDGLGLLRLDVERHRLDRQRLDGLDLQRQRLVRHRLVGHREQRHRVDGQRLRLDGQQRHRVIQ